MPLLGERRCRADGAFHVPAQELERSHGNPLLGAFVEERFGLVGIIGFGGNTTVFEAWDEVAGTPAAVKVLRVEAGDPRALDALANEWRATRELEAVRGVPAARGFFEGSVGSARFNGFARDFVRPLLGKPGLVEVAGWARTLNAAHARGRVHGDLSPTHLMADAIIDWGSSSLAESTTPALGFHELYASPELRRGEPATPASDWFGLAASVAAMTSRAEAAELGLDGMLAPDPPTRLEAAAVWVDRYPQPDR